MKVLHHNDLDYSTLSSKYARIISHLEEVNFSALDVKKIPEASLYRVKLDYENRLLFRFGNYKGETCILLLEIIYQHDYAGSRFLRGKKVDESSLVPVNANVPYADAVELSYLNSARCRFHYLDKVISFDDSQQEIFTMRPPVIIIGSAGSGKTVLTLEKIKTLTGSVLYITLSPYLVQNSAKLYYSENYANENQEIDFLSYKEFIETMQIPEGREMEFRIFEEWFSRHRQTVKIKDAHKLYEEFGGVITGSSVDKEYLSRDEYLALGMRQSVFLSEEREQAYGLFEKYIRFLKENNYYDLNIISHRWQPLCLPRYDFLVIDEIQDITTVQLFLILKSLKKAGNFILCGDSNQIVHPNFFSWASVKSLFYKNQELSRDTIKILHTNYRNSPRITGIANRLLKIKNQRFGSIDKESAYLVNTLSEQAGEVTLFANNERNRVELDSKTRASARFAVIVMRNDDKAQARAIFRTPLLFSIHEAKGLEYDNVILVNFISDYDREFRDITDGVDAATIDSGELNYSRAKDKTDKSLDVYKFYINSLYVAITRSVRNLYLLESAPRHRILEMLGLTDVREQVNISAQASSLDEWKKEALRLEQQGKAEQAEAIRRNLLGATQKVPWEPLTVENMAQLKHDALNPDNFNKKAKDKLFDFALLNDDEETAFLLSQAGYKRAEKFREERNSIFRKYYAHYAGDNVKAVMNEAGKYGADYRDPFNLTPLMIAAMTGAVRIARLLLAAGANPSLTDNFGKNALQLALFQSYFSMQYAAAKIGLIYPLLVTDHLKVKIDSRLIKLGNHQIGFFIVNYMIAIQSSVINQREYFEAKGLRMDDLLDKFAALPGNILYDYRKKRAYLSAHFSSNEINRDAPGNKILYQRVDRGHYILNPDMEVLIGDEWKNVYELMKADKIKKDDKLAMLRRRRVSYESMVKNLTADLNSGYYDSKSRNIILERLNSSRNTLSEITSEIQKIVESKSSMEQKSEVVGTDKASEFSQEPPLIAKT